VCVNVLSNDCSCLVCSVTRCLSAAASSGESILRWPQLLSTQVSNRIPNTLNLSIGMSFDQLVYRDQFEIPFFQFGQQPFQSRDNPVMRTVEQTNVAGLYLVQNGPGDPVRSTLHPIIRPDPPPDGQVPGPPYRLSQMGRCNPVRRAEKKRAVTYDRRKSPVRTAEFLQPLRGRMEINGRRMREGMVTYGMTLIVQLPDQLRMLGHPGAYTEKRRADAVLL